MMNIDGIAVKHLADSASLQLTGGPWGSRLCLLDPLVTPTLHLDPLVTPTLRSPLTDARCEHGL